MPRIHPDWLVIPALIVVVTIVAVISGRSSKHDNTNDPVMVQVRQEFAQGDQVIELLRQQGITISGSDADVSHDGIGICQYAVRYDNLDQLTDWAVRSNTPVPGEVEVLGLPTVPMDDRMGPVMATQMRVFCPAELIRLNNNTP